MLSDARARNDALGQAYAELHADLASLKASGSGDHHHHHHPPHQGAAPFPTAAGPAAGLGGYVDTSIGSLHAGGGDLDVFLYPAVGGYSM